MSADSCSGAGIRALRFHGYGEPAEVLRLERTPPPHPGAGRIRAVVHACGLTPADWALCRGLFPGSLPRGIGLEVAGVVDAIGDGVTDVSIGDRVLGATDYAGAPSAGAADAAILSHWARMPAALAYTDAAAIPMAMETAYRSLEQLGVTAGRSVVVHGAGTTVGFAAVQIALMRGARVVATAGVTYADRLRALGAMVTSYGEGVADRVLQLAGGPLDLALDTAPPHRAANTGAGHLPDLIRIVGGVPRRVLTIADFVGGAKLGVRTSLGDSEATLDDHGRPQLSTTARRHPGLRYCSASSRSSPRKARSAFRSRGRSRSRTGARRSTAA